MKVASCFTIMNLPIILHIPHSSTEIPDEIRPQLVLLDEELRNEILMMTDLYTDNLFSPNNSKYDSVIFPISRLVLDPERFIDDEMESMSKIGMGVVYTKTSQGEKLRRAISETERDFLINTYYRPHHEKLTNAVEKKLSEHGSVLIIDCHSFPSVPLPYEFNKSINRPDVCIGTDDFHTHSKLSRKCADFFQQKGYSVKFNEPFSGSLVPDKYYQKNRHVQSLMIEINRGLYMDEKTGGKNSGYGKVKLDIERVLSKLTILNLQ